jgi:hypothetical protein
MIIKSTHAGYKTYYATDVTRTLRPINTLAQYAPEEDHLVGGVLIKMKYRVFMDSDKSASGIFPVVKEDTDLATRFPFAESEGLFYIKTTPISASQ